MAGDVIFETALPSAAMCLLESMMSAEIQRSIRRCNMKPELRDDLERRWTFVAGVGRKVVVGKLVRVYRDYVVDCVHWNNVSISH